MKASSRRKRARKAIAMREIAAAALSLLLPEAERNALRQARVPARHIISLFTPDHIVFHAFGGSDRWYNLHMTRRGPELKAKDARDTSTIAKIRNIVDAHEEFRRRLLAKPCGQKRERRGSIPSRPFPKSKRRVKRPLPQAAEEGEA